MNPVNPISLRLSLLFAVALSHHAGAAVTHYVDLNSPSPVSPYLSWGTAARTIQSAVDAGSAGDLILVTNGVYQTGGRVTGVLYNYTTNRLAVNKAVTVQSVNGPAVTIIQGYQVPGTTNGNAAVRCVYLTNNATLSGFTLTNGATRTSSINGSQDVSGGGALCAASTSILTNCVLSGNAAAANGGGAYGGTLKNCTVAGNWSGSAGGGACTGTLNGCALYGNYAVNTGGGADTATLNNCTVVANSAGNTGGGFYSLNFSPGSGANNCIIYFNTAPANPNYYFLGPPMNYCCTTPLPGFGPGNIASEPQLASPSHLSAGSPCRTAGTATYATGVDIDGEAWANPPSIGCDQYRPGSLTGPLTVALQASYTNVATGFLVDFTAQINGRTSASRWDFGDGTVVSNRPFASHAWAAAGDYTVLLQAYNESNASGVSAALVVHVAVPPVYYVSVNGTNPVAPYASWATAATNIHDAIDASSLPGALVLVSDGLYAVGGRALSAGDLTNRLAVTTPVTVQSLNGHSTTIIQGYQAPDDTFGTNAVRCVYLANGACLVGFTLTNGATTIGGKGAGALCASTRAALFNCVVAGNASGGTAGGVYSGTLNNCAIFNNSAASTGGGVYLANLNNCTVTANSALSAGGVYSSVLYDCIVFYNTAASSLNYDARSTLNYSCSSPLASGPGNIALEPQLASLTHLAAGSPCQGAGKADYAGGVDIDGEAWTSPPSMGCDEVYPGSIAGSLTAAIQAPYTNLSAGFAAAFTALISGRTSSSVWDFGDGTLMTNRPVITHSWSAPGDYPVVLQAFNESNLAGVTSTVTVHVVSQSLAYAALGSTNPVAPYNSWDTAATNIQDAVDAVYPGGLVLVSDGVYQTGGRVVFGALSNRLAVTKPVTVQSLNGPAATIIQGYQVPGTTNGNAAVRCVYLTNSATLSGFTLTNGATRSTGDSSQEQSGGAVWCWSTSAVVSNCVLSGNTSAFEGGGANSGTLNNCTLTGNSSIFGGGTYVSTLNRCFVNGNAGDQGGGALSSVINNSILAGNTSTFGGGALDSTLNNCLVISNASSFTGGGTDAGYLTNCTLVGNTATTAGGGAYAPTAQNCLLFYNSSPSGPNFNGGSLNYCCTPQVPSTGTGNITNAPLFVDPAGGNLRLQSSSPCINSGYPAVMPPGPDLNGNPRVVGGTVDIGAYEYQFPLSLISYAWLQQYGLPTDGSADFADTDADGMSNLQEWIAGTGPTDPTSNLRLLNPTVTASNVLVRWPGVARRSYFVQRGPNLATPVAFTTIATNFIGLSGTNTFRDTNAPGPGPVFYRLGVHF
jgi:hypothetical protein